MAEIDAKLVKWDAAPQIDPKSVKWDVPTQEEPTALDRAARVAGIGSRAIIGGLAGPSLMIGEGANQLYNLGARALGADQRPSVMEGFNTFLTNAGLAAPATTAERFSTGITSALAGAGSQMDLARQAATLPQTASNLVRETLLQQPARQAVAATTGATAATAAGEMGAGPLGQALAGMAGGALPFAGQMASGQPSRATEPARRTLESARESGYVVPPSQLPGAGFGTRKLEGLAGKIMTAQEAAQHNQEITNSLARKALNLPEDSPITIAVLNQERSNLAAPYREVSAISAAAGKTLEALKESRSKATQHYQYYDRSADPKALATAKIADRTSEMLELRLENFARNSGKPELINELRSARQGIAKTYDVERALNVATGTVDARILGKALDKGKPLSGPLLTAAKFAESNPRATQTPEQIGSMPSESPFNFGTGAVLSGIGYGATGGPAGALLGVLPFLRSPLRSVLLSEPYQNALMGPQSPLTRQDAATLGILSGFRAQQ